MVHDISFKSFNGRDTVYGGIYAPTCKPKGIVQIVHGLGEHARRYIHTISAFLDAGYIVAADDHVGHGRTAQANNTWGDWGEAGPHTMTEDEHTLKDIVCEKYPGLPYFMFGHSLGSFVTRDFISKYGGELAGTILCGTGTASLGAKKASDALKKLIDDGKRAEIDPEISGLMFGWMCERFGENCVGNEWTCADPYVRKDHAEDPFGGSGRSTKNCSLYDMVNMMMQVDGAEWAEKVPKGLPVYNIAGDQDPVGNYGLGVYTVSNWLAQTGHSVKTKLYTGYRHEIQYYSDIVREVEAGIIAFMDEITASK